MAPPIPVYSRAEMAAKYPAAFGKQANCKFSELVQSQCTFNGVEIICLPFKRVFAQCGADARRVEITGIDTNNYSVFNDSYKRENNEDILQKFLDADKMLRRAYDLELEKVQD